MYTHALSMHAVRSNALRFGEKAEGERVTFTTTEISNLDALFDENSKKRHQIKTVITSPLVIDGVGYSFYLGRQIPSSDLNVVLQKNGRPLRDGNFWLRRQEQALYAQQGAAVLKRPDCIPNDTAWKEILKKLKTLTLENVEQAYCS